MANKVSKFNKKSAASMHQVVSRSMLDTEKFIDCGMPELAKKEVDKVQLVFELWLDSLGIVE